MTVQNDSPGTPAIPRQPALRCADATFHTARSTVGVMFAPDQDQRLAYPQVIATRR
jgi:hypothetical protein